MTENCSQKLPLNALCHTTNGEFVVAVENLTPDGCSAIAPSEWAEDFDFLRLTLAGQAEINGRVTAHDGRQAEIRFFGQIHPRAIEGWARAA